MISQFEEAFFNHAKDHLLLSHLSYAESPVEGQQIIGVLVDEDNDPTRAEENYNDFQSFINELINLEHPDNSLIDPNWDLICEHFVTLANQSDECKQYIKDLLAAQTREEFADYIMHNIVKKLIASNINAKNVYIVISKYCPTDIFDKVMEV